MAKFSPLMMAPPVIFAGLALMFGLAMMRDDPDALPTALAGKPAPAVQLQPLGQDQPFQDASLRDGQVKLVNFWASWCAPCRVEHPNLEQMAQSGVPILGVNYKDKPEAALKFLAELGNPYAALGADPEGRMAINWGVYGVPETYVVDGQGNIIMRHAGPITQRTVTDTLLPAIQAAQAK